MLGAIAGDIIGSAYEFNPIKTKEFPLFSKYSHLTDDTILTIAVADAILHNAKYVDKIKEYARRYPSSYGLNFQIWAYSDSKDPYNSYGNGSAMRVSPLVLLLTI